MTEIKILRVCLAIIIAAAVALAFIYFTTN